MTIAEKKLWAEVRKHKLPLRRQAPIGAYIVDFACHSARLVIEIDGGIHNLPEVAVRDLAKADWLSSRGYRVLRFSNDQVLEDPEAIAAKIAAAVGSPPTQPIPPQGGRA
jgi:very-short-patch-repair endonuclease